MREELAEQRYALNSTMILLPIAIMLCVPFACASLSSCNETIVSSFDVSEVSSTANCNTRTLWSIIWSCAATLFACTWTAIHPNIPGMDESRFIVMSRRLFIMVMALVAPELIITWAARQYFSARSTAEDFSGTFSTQPAQACDNCRIIGGEGTVTSILLPGLPLSHGRSPSPSAPQAAGVKFEGQFICILSVATNINHWLRSMDIDAWVLHLDGWIYALC